LRLYTSSVSFITHFYKDPDGFSEFCIENPYPSTVRAMLVSWFACATIAAED